MKLPPIPGLHKRKCKDCKKEVSIPDEMTEVIASNRFVEKKRARCPSCHEDIILMLPKGENQGSTEDIEIIDAVLKRMFGKKKTR